MAYIGLGAGTVRIYGSLRATSLTLARVILTQMHVVIDGGIEVTGGPTTSQSYVGTTYGKRRSPSVGLEPTTTRLRVVRSTD
jgi:hypothetical protein